MSQDTKIIKMEWTDKIDIVVHDKNKETIHVLEVEERQHSALKKHCWQCVKHVGHCCEYLALFLCMCVFYVSLFAGIVYLFSKK